MSRTIDQVVPATVTATITRLIGTVDIDGNGTSHPLAEVDPFILLDMGKIPKHNMPPFGAHPHRGHSVVTILLQGQVKSWDSCTGDESTLVLKAPSAYWVDAASGVFHDEKSVIDDESDPTQHMELFQLWIGVREEDRQKPPRVQHDSDLVPLELKDTNNAIVGSGLYYVGGPNSNIETPHPISVCLVQQTKGTTYRHPVDAKHGGFVVHRSGCPSFAGTTPPNVNDVLVLNNRDTESEYLEVTTTPEEDAEYLICTGEKNNEKWYKKSVANGAIITATPEEAQELAPKVEAMSKAGKAGGSFAPFGV